MVHKRARHYHHTGVDERASIVELRAQGVNLSDISLHTKVKLSTVKSVLDKWNQHHTLEDLPKTGRPPIVDPRTERRLARMAQSGEVNTASELVLVAASQGNRPH